MKKAMSFSEHGNSTLLIWTVTLWRGTIVSKQLQDVQRPCPHFLYCAVGARLPTLLIVTSWALAIWLFFFWVTALCTQAGTLYEKQMFDRTKRRPQRFLSLSGQSWNGFTFPGRLWNPLATLFLNCERKEKGRNKSWMFDDDMSENLICSDCVLFSHVALMRPLRLQAVLFHLHLNLIHIYHLVNTCIPHWWKWGNGVFFL